MGGAEEFRNPHSGLRNTMRSACRLAGIRPGQNDRFVALFRLPNGEGGPGAEAVVSV